MELFQLHTGSAESSEEKSQSQEQILSLSDDSDNVKVRQRFSSQMIREKSQQAQLEEQAEMPKDDQ